MQKIPTVCMAWQNDPGLGPASITFLLDFPYLGLTGERLVCKLGKSMGKCEKMQHDKSCGRIEDGRHSLAQVVDMQPFQGWNLPLGQPSVGPL